jgi:protein-L-isoaspartate(D-aspartate) O-methyltransferase
MDPIAEAFVKTPRDAFLHVEEQDYADLDAPLSIGYGQTNSQPTTVRMMLEWLDVKPGQKVLDVGSGSGWTTALLACLVGPKGRVVAVEKVPELVKFGETNVKKLGRNNISFHVAKSGVFGWPDDAPFDRILVSAAPDQLPDELLDQLKLGGKMVIPVKTTMLVLEKTPDGRIKREAYPGFSFVPLVR